MTIHMLTGVKRLAVDEGDGAWDANEIAMLDMAAVIDSRQGGTATTDSIEVRTYSKEARAFLLQEYRDPDAKWVGDAKNVLRTVLLERVKLTEAELHPPPPKPEPIPTVKTAYVARLFMDNARKAIGRVHPHGLSCKDAELFVAPRNVSSWDSDPLYSAELAKIIIELGSASGSEVSNEDALKKLEENVGALLSAVEQDGVVLSSAEEAFAGKHGYLGDLLVKNLKVAIRDAENGNPQNAQNLAGWRKLSSDVREDVLKSASYQPRFNLGSHEAPLAEFTVGTKGAVLAEQMHDHMDANCYLEDHTHADGLTAFGDMQITVTIYKLPSGEIAGGSITFRQGVVFDDEHDDEPPTSADDSYNAHGLFDYNGEPLRCDDHMEP